MAMIPKRFAGRITPRPDFFFHFHGIDHDDRVPGTTIEEAAVRPLAQAFLAADAENGIDRDAAKRRMIFVRHPEHAVFHRTIFNARRRAGASGAALGDDGQLFGLFLARSGQTLRSGFELLVVRNHPNGLGGTGYGRHAGIIP
jgi:hypothetical protein